MHVLPDAMHRTAYAAIDFIIDPWVEAALVEVVPVLDRMLGEKSLKSKLAKHDQCRTGVLLSPCLKRGYETGKDKNVRMEGGSALGLRSE